MKAHRPDAAPPPTQPHADTPSIQPSLPRYQHNRRPPHTPQHRTRQKRVHPPGRRHPAHTGTHRYPTNPNNPHQKPTQPPVPAPPHHRNPQKHTHPPHTGTQPTQEPTDRRPIPTTCARNQHNPQSPHNLQRSNPQMHIHLPDTNTRPHRNPQIAGQFQHPAPEAGATASSRTTRGTGTGRHKRIRRTPERGPHSNPQIHARNKLGTQPAQRFTQAARAGRPW